MIHVILRFTSTVNRLKRLVYFFVERVVGAQQARRIVYVGPRTAGEPAEHSRDPGGAS